MTAECAARNLSAGPNPPHNFALHELEQLRDAALSDVSGAADEQALEAARVRYLGRAGSVSAWAERMKSLSKEEKPVVGKLLNEARTSVTAAITERAERLRREKEAR